MGVLKVDACGNFYRIQRINDKHHIYSSGKNIEGLHYAELVSNVEYILITNKMATYKELKYDLDIDDVIKMYEICMVNLYNKNVMYENNK